MDALNMDQLDRTEALLPWSYTPAQDGRKEPMTKWLLMPSGSTPATCLGTPDASGELPPGWPVFGSSASLVGHNRAARHTVHL